MASARNVRATAFLLVLVMLGPLAHAQNLGETLQECPGTLTGSTQPQQIHLQMTDDASVMNVIWATEGRSMGEVEWDG